MAREIRLGDARVAVTGAGGFIGGAVCRRLLADGAAVTAIDLGGPALARLEGAGAAVAPADVTDAEAMRGALAGSDALVHCAAIVSDAGTMRDHVEVNVRGTAVTLAAAAEAGIERALHVSSVVVFGYESADVLDETAHPRVTGVPYIDTKSASDRLARRRGAVVVRPGDVYGPGSVPWTIRPAGLARAGLLAVVGDGSGAMLAVYIDDLVEGVALALTRGRPGEAYTIFNDADAVSFARYFDALGALAGTRARRVPAPLLRGAGLLAELGGRLTGSPPALTRHAVVMLRREGGATAAKAREELGWAPEVDLEEGMRRTGEWLHAEGLL